MKGLVWLSSGLLVGLLLVSAISVGTRFPFLSEVDSFLNWSEFRQDSSLVVGQINQLAAVNSTWDIIADWLSPLADWLKVLWRNFVDNWQKFFGLNPREEKNLITPEIREQIRQELLTDLRDRGLLNTNILSSETGDTRYGIMVVPSTGSTTRDEWLKKSLSQMFADEVSLRFDKSGMSGVVTPTFRDGRKGGDYVFVLTPLK